MTKTQNNKRFIFILKAIACLLITNSHCRNIYPFYFLAIGGGFGNAIFLLVSGYCLAYPKLKFKNWYPTRLKRLMIPMTFVGLIAIFLNLQELSSIGFLSSLKWIIDKYWFVFAIIIYYPVYYLIFIKKDNKWALASLTAHFSIYAVLYVVLLLLNPDTFFIEQDGFSPIKVFFYFGVMLLGGCMRRFENEENSKLSSLLKHKWQFYFILTALGFVIWTVVYFSIFVLEAAYAAQIIIPLSAALFAFAFFKLCMAFEENKVLARVSDKTKILAESTLEIYLVQVTLVGYCEKLAFPLNTLAFWGSAIALGIALHIALNALLNAFKKEKGNCAMKKKVLILNGSFCEIPLIEQAHKLGYYVVTTGNAPHLIGHSYADEYIPADYSNKEAILKLVKDNNIEHIISCANDFGVLTAAYVAEKMGWQGHDSYENAELLHLKDKFKEYLKNKGIPSPISSIFSSAESAKEYLDTAKYPVIVKATDLTGGKGIMKAENKEEGYAAVDYAYKASRSDNIVIEPFVTGVQQTFVAFLQKKKVVSYTGCNSYSPINPYLIQAETLPAEDLEDISAKLSEIIEFIAEDLSLADGVFAFQLIRNGKDFNIIEMMRRPFGNQFLQLVEDNTDFPWHLAQVITQTGGDSSSLERIEKKRKFCGHHGIMAEKNGTLVSYSIPLDIEEHIYKKVEMCAPGERIENCMNERVAYIFFEYDSLDEMNEAVKSFNSRITVEMA